MLCLYGLCDRIAAAEGDRYGTTTDRTDARKNTAEKSIVKLAERLYAMKRVTSRPLTQKLTAEIVMLCSELFEFGGEVALLNIE